LSCSFLPLHTQVTGIVITLSVLCTCFVYVPILLAASDLPKGNVPIDALFPRFHPNLCEIELFHPELCPELYTILTYVRV
jgi:hypothetical protein